MEHSLSLTAPGERKRATEQLGRVFSIRVGVLLKAPPGKILRLFD